MYYFIKNAETATVLEIKR